MLRIHALDSTNDDASSVDTASVHSGHEDHHGSDFLSKSYHGTFAGMLILAAAIIIGIMFFFERGESANVAMIMYYSTDIFIHAALLVATVLGVLKLQKLNFVEKPASVDDILLYIALTGALLYELSMLIAAVDFLAHGSRADDHHVIFAPSDTAEKVDQVLAAGLSLTSNVLSFLQSIAQVTLIFSGMRRYPSKAKHVKNMPGRSEVSFAIVANVSIWIFRSLIAKDELLHDYSLDFYGDLAWLLLVNISLPLLLFFRFHSSICLVDVWHTAYTPLLNKVAPDPVHHPPEPSTTTAHRSRSASTTRLPALLQSVSVSDLSTRHSREEADDRPTMPFGAPSFKATPRGSMRSAVSADNIGSSNML